MRSPPTASSSPSSRSIVDGSPSCSPRRRWTCSWSRRWCISRGRSRAAGPRSTCWSSRSTPCSCRSVRGSSPRSWARRFSWPMRTSRSPDRRAPGSGGRWRSSPWSSWWWPFSGQRLRAASVEQTQLAIELRRVRLEADEILRNIRSGVLTVDGQGRLAFINLAAEHLLGITAAESAWRCRCWISWSIDPPSSSPRWCRAFARAAGSIAPREPPGAPTGARCRSGSRPPPSRAPTRPFPA